MKPYPFQTKIIEEVRQALRAGYKSPIVVSPTGSGKTIVFAIIAQGAMKKDKRVLILVHRKEILEQTLKKLYLLGVQAGQIAAGKPMTKDQIQVAMVGTLVRRLDLIKKPDLIIFDEGHHFLPDNSWGKIGKHFSDTPHIGFTATPSRADGRGLCETYDAMIEGPSISMLVKEDYLSYPVMYRPPEEITEKFHIKRGDFDTVEQEDLYYKKKHIVGDVIRHYRKYLNYLPTVCFCVSVKHTHFMADAFRNAGYVAVAVYGGMKKTDREIAINGLANGSIHVVCSCDLISEGVDVPVMAGAILLRKTLSLGLYLQQVGRALRKFPGKEKAVILDHAGNYYLHGHVLADRKWSLDAGKRNHRKEKPPTTTSCPKCYGVWPGEPRTCPECGFNFSDNENIAGQQRKTPEVIEGELITALPDGVETGQIKNMAAFLARIQSFDPKQRQRAMIAKAHELQDRQKIDALGRAVGYKPGWTHFVWTKILKNR